MTVTAITPDPQILPLLPRHHFADSYQTRLANPSLTAADAAKRIFNTPPRWVSLLMAARNRFAALSGLRTVGIDAFPVLEQSDQRVVLGFDDRHLDFRIILTVTRADAQSSLVAVTTLVRLNNLLGRIYLTAILPFHRQISRTMLERIG